MVLENQGSCRGNDVKWGRVEKKGGPREGQWMVDIRGPLVIAEKPNSRNPYKQFFEKTETALLARAERYLGGRIVRTGTRKPKEKVLSSTTTYRDHNFAWGAVQKVGGPHQGKIMIRITGGRACPPGSGYKNFFTQTEQEAIAKAERFVDAGLG